VDDSGIVIESGRIGELDYPGEMGTSINVLLLNEGLHIMFRGIFEANPTAVDSAML
jgi:hypothetical protein